MIYIKHFKYTQKEAVVFAKTDCKILFGTEEIKLKENKYGYNHSDLAKAAFQYFFSWPNQKKFLLKKGEKITIKPFEAYVISGNYEITEDENIFFIS